MSGDCLAWGINTIKASRWSPSGSVALLKYQGRHMFSGQVYTLVKCGIGGGWFRKMVNCFSLITCQVAMLISRQGWHTRIEEWLTMVGFFCEQVGLAFISHTLQVALILKKATIQKETYVHRLRFIVDDSYLMIHCWWFYNHLQTSTIVYKRRRRADDGEHVSDCIEERRWRACKMSACTKARCSTRAIDSSFATLVNDCERL